MENFHETSGKNLNNFRKILRILKAIRKLCKNYESTLEKFWTNNVENIFDKISYNFFDDFDKIAEWLEGFLKILNKFHESLN